MNGIWIRSQDKNRLIFATNVYIDDYGNFTLVKADSRIIGEYPTKERALQVLDEIQAVIVDYINTISYNITQASNGQFDRIYPIYVMPAE